MLHIRRFLFQTAFASGALPGFPPFTPPEKRGDESRVLLPVFAIRRGLEEDKVADVVGGVLEPAGCFSAALVAALLAVAFAARNVLLTETALKAGFLAVEPARP